MGRWDYRLISGKALRSAIDNEDPVAVLKALEKAYEELAVKFPDIFDEYFMEDISIEIESEIDTINHYDEYDMDYEDALDNVDGLLDEFYNLCDDLRVWVEMD